MTHNPGLMQAIVSSPDDDAPRLVYADWLDDQGESLRAEFIRLQCRIAQLCVSTDSPLNERLPAIGDLDLRPEFRRQLLAPLADLGLTVCENPHHYDPEAIRGCNFIFRRGFVETIDVRGFVEATTFVDRAEEVLARIPLMHLQFQLPYPPAGAEERNQLVMFRLFQSLIRVAGLTRLRSLWMTGLEVTDEVGKLLLDSPLHGRDTRVNLGTSRASSEIVATLIGRFGDQIVYDEELPF